MIKYAFFAGAALALVSTSASAGILGGSQAKPSSGRKEQTSGMQQIPVNAPTGSERWRSSPPDKEWWRELNLGSPEAIIKVFVQQSGCFTIVNRDRAMQ